MSIIKADKLTFSYDGSNDYVFYNANFSLDTDWKTGFIGMNGRGKTTFLKLLMGRFEYSGSISHSVNFDYFPYEPKDSSYLTIDIIEEILPNFELWEINREFNLLELSEDCLYRPLNLLSNGERTKALLAALFLKEGNFLLIDEPTDHLDAHARNVVGNYLKNKKGFILVSHDRYFLDTCIDHVLSLNKNSIDVIKGNYSVWKENKERRDSFEIAENNKLSAEILKLSTAAAKRSENALNAEKEKYSRDSGGREFIDRGFLGSKSAKLMKSSKVLENRQNKSIEEKSKLLKDIETTGKLKINTIKHYRETLVEARDLSIFYGEREVFSHLDFKVCQGDRIFFNGKNGSGKSSIIKLITGQNISFSGTLNLAPNLNISYVPQDTSFLRGSLRDFCIEGGVDETLFKTILSKMNFGREHLNKDLTELSSGQKKKALLAKSLCKPSHLYIWDEPLNFIDILSRLQIEELIKNNNPTMLLVEHDEAFLKNISTKEIYL